MKLIFFSIAVACALAIAPALAETLSGVVKHDDGSPAAGVPVAIASEGEGMVEIRGGKLKWDQKAKQTTTDAEGRFSIEKPNGYYSLASADDSGYGVASSSQFDALHQITLERWARVEGRIRVGSKPGANQNYLINDTGGGGYRRPRPHVFYDGQSDAEGRFILEKAPPIWLRIGREATHPAKTDKGTFTGMSVSHFQVVRPKPGETIQVTIGGVGRPVIGKLVPPEEVKSRIAFLGGEPPRVNYRSSNRPKSVNRPSEREGSDADWDRYEQSEEYAAWLKWQVIYAPSIEKDGAFRVDDVPPGEYQIVLTVNFRDRHPMSDPVGGVSHIFVMPEVPGGQSDEPLDLGDLPIKIYDNYRPDPVK